MIAMSEILQGKNLEDQSSEVQASLAILLDRVNQVRVLWNQPMTVTSGLRTMEDHLRIYAQKGITDPSKIPMHSKHLYGKAVDIFDPKLELTAWLKSNDSQVLKDVGLWCEEGNKNWVHFQIEAPGSGNRWFLP